MGIKFKKQLNIQYLILIFTLVMTAATLMNAFHSAWRVQKQILIDDALFKHQADAEKIAATIDLFLQMGIQHLSYSAAVIGSNLTNRMVIFNETERVQRQDSGFDSILLLDTSGKLVGRYPESTELTGQQLDSTGIMEALKIQRPRISNVYRSVSGALMVLVSVPVRDKQGRYLGLLGGIIYLQKNNILASLIQNYYQRNNSYIYLVDKHDVLLFHPIFARVGDKEEGNAVVEAVEKGGTGSMEVTNSRGGCYVSRVFKCVFSRLGDCFTTIP